MEGGEGGERHGSTAPESEVRARSSEKEEEVEYRCQEGFQSSPKSEQRNLLRSNLTAGTESATGDKRKPARQQSHQRNQRRRQHEVYYPTDEECNPPWINYAKEYPPPLRTRHAPQTVKGLYRWQSEAKEWVLVPNTSAEIYRNPDRRVGPSGKDHVEPLQRNSLEPQTLSFGGVGDENDKAHGDASRTKSSAMTDQKRNQEPLVSCLKNNVYKQYDSIEVKRGKAILQIVEARRPTVVALQEVGRDGGSKILEQIILRSQFIRERYFVTDFKGRSVVILSQIQAVVERVNLITEMNRFCLVLRTVVNGKSLAFATTHLESVDRLRRRRKQLGQIARFFSKFPSDYIVLGGDLNFGDENHPSTNKSDPRENDSLGILLPSFADLWPAINAGDPGFTMDTKTNGMFEAQKGFDKNGREERMRLDRVLFHASCKIWTAESIETIGGESLGFSSLNKWPILPSDHFGLLAKLRHSRAGCAARCA
eukprot:CAMPEP_0114537616 /NCGR_PEP_ID=MMETSP0109-20121206/29676_1 /TAXON_ID=29199 /ORGANISM="Chlorarachnion reptans, Strain CCCM449" /LENGTH=480 /DNA_ID=CAMNT_0001721523 /DNA_START=57 /DNA_END=1495 /DNA_ORIENTATION=+